MAAGAVVLSISRNCRHALHAIIGILTAVFTGSVWSRLVKGYSDSAPEPQAFTREVETMGVVNEPDEDGIVEGWPFLLGTLGHGCLPHLGSNKTTETHSIPTGEGIHRISSDGFAGKSAKGFLQVLWPETAA